MGCGMRLVHSSRRVYATPYANHEISMCSCRNARPPSIKENPATSQILLATHHEAVLLPHAHRVTNHHDAAAVKGTALQGGGGGVDGEHAQLSTPRQAAQPG